MSCEEKPFSDRTYVKQQFLNCLIFFFIIVFHWMCMKTALCHFPFPFCFKEGKPRKNIIMIERSFTEEAKDFLNFLLYSANPTTCQEQHEQVLAKFSSCFFPQLSESMIYRLAVIVKFATMDRLLTQGVKIKSSGSVSA